MLNSLFTYIEQTKKIKKNVCSTDIFVKPKWKIRDIVFFFLNIQGFIIKKSRKYFNLNYKELWSKLLFNLFFVRPIL